MSILQELSRIGVLQASRIIRDKARSKTLCRCSDPVTPLVLLLLGWLQRCLHRRELTQWDVNIVVIKDLLQRLPLLLGHLVWLGKLWRLLLCIVKLNLLRGVILGPVVSFFVLKEVVYVKNVSEIYETICFVGLFTHLIIHG